MRVTLTTIGTPAYTGTNMHLTFHYIIRLSAESILVRRFREAARGPGIAGLAPNPVSPNKVGGEWQRPELPASLWKHFQPLFIACLLYTSPSPRDGLLSRMPSSA